MDDLAKAREAQLRRLATLEIAHHREREGFLGAALDGSLATGTVWPSSDVDFLVVPLAAAEQQHGVEWREREGIVCHKHLNGAERLRALIDGYPESFVRPAVGRFSADENWELDGLAVMDVVEDPEGLLAEVQRFVAAHRFAPEVWEGRRAGLLQELRRLRDQAQSQLDSAAPEQALAVMARLTGFPGVAAQIWLEAARRIYSSKEQDGQLAEVTCAAGHPDVHTLYRRALAVDPERALAAEPLVLDVGDWGCAFYRELAGLPLPDAEAQQSAPVLEAWVRHFAHTLSLAPRMGHPAYLYQRLDALRYWTAERPAEIAAGLGKQGVAGLTALETSMSRVAMLIEEIEELLWGLETVEERALAAVSAADQLLAITERAL